jgi:hypothetical protein
MSNQDPFRWSSEAVWSEDPKGTGFFATHASGIFFAAIGEAMSLLVLIYLGPIILKWGMAATFYFGLVFFAIAAFAYLPIHWALRHRRLRRIVTER